MTAAIWASALLDAALAIAALAVLRRRERPGRAALALAAAIAAIWLAKLWLLLQVGLTQSFGVVHLLYLDAVVAIPLVALAALLSRLQRPRRRNALLILPVLGLLLAPVGVYASFVEPYRLQVEAARVPLPEERAGRAPLRVAVLADLQTAGVGEHEKRAVEEVMAARPHLIVLPGDLLQHPGTLERDGADVRRLLSRLSAPGGVWFVEGDAETPRKTRELLAGTGVRLLANETAGVRVEDRRVTLGGIELDYTTPAARRTVAELERRPGSGDVRLLLAHRPDPVLQLPRQARVDLVVAGHTHGGQVQVPGFGPPVIASHVPRDVGAGGLHSLGARRRIYVSRGVGMERGQAPPLRLFAPPEVSILTLR